MVMNCISILICLKCTSHIGKTLHTDTQCSNAGKTFLMSRNEVTEIGEGGQEDVKWKGKSTFVQFVGKNSSFE